ncbi:MAG: hypothetical protein JNM00_15955 [Flavobacteriales bacterium]|nr:hypothetical protein [Flavobacteriales bacterium]
MKPQTHKKVAGLWIDHEQALIVSTSDHTPHGDYNVIGKVKAGHHAFHSSNENASNHQRHAELEKYFKEVSKNLHQFDEVLVFGPGKAQEEFVNHAHADKQMANKKFEMSSTGNLTENQMTAHVREHFSKYGY